MFQYIPPYYYYFWWVGGILQSNGQNQSRDQGSERGKRKRYIDFEGLRSAHGTIA